MGNTKPPVKPVKLAAGAGWLWMNESDAIAVGKPIWDYAPLCYVDPDDDTYALDEGGTITVTDGLITAKTD